jgi:DNA-binding response OmpR family regulator
MQTSVKKRSSREPALEKSTILAVCPSQDDLRSLKDILESEEWTVCPAHTCHEAARLMQTATPAVVACDHQLPDGSWKDMYKLAASLMDPPPLVVVSRHADETLWAEVLNLGGYDVIAKPFERNEVSRVMQMACRHGRAAFAH